MGVSHTCCGSHGHFPKQPLVLFDALFFLEGMAGGTHSAVTVGEYVLSEMSHAHSRINGA